MFWWIVLSLLVRYSECLSSHLGRFTKTLVGPEKFRVRGRGVIYCCASWRWGYRILPAHGLPMAFNIERSAIVWCAPSFKKSYADSVCTALYIATKKEIKQVRANSPYICQLFANSHSIGNPLIIRIISLPNVANSYILPLQFKIHKKYSCFFHFQCPISVFSD